MPARLGRIVVLAIVTLLALGAVVAAFLAGGDPNADSGDKSASRALAGAPAAPAPAAAPAPEAGAGTISLEGLGGTPTRAVARASPASRVIKTAEITIGVGKAKLDDALQSVHFVVDQAGGWSQSSERGPDQRQATIVAKVPSDQFDVVVGKVKQLGKLRSESIKGEDVGEEYVDLEARLVHWRAQEAVFLAIMAKAKTIPETIQVQQQLSAVQQEIERIEGRRRYLDAQTSFSTLRLTVVQSGVAAKSLATARPQNASVLGEAWRDAAGAALAVVGGTLVVLGVVVPLALVVGIPGLIVLAVRRRSRPLAA